MRMKKFDIGKSFNNSRFKYGGYSALSAILVLAVLVAVNLVASKLDIKKDLSKDKVYSITDQSVNIVKSLKNDVIIYAFFETGNEDPNVKMVLDKYESSSKKVSVEYRDPIKQPQLAKKYSTSDKTVGAGSIVVESGSKFKTVDYNDLYNYSSDQYGQTDINSFAAEQQITNAIIYVTSGTQHTLYTLTGHQEKQLDADIKKQLDAENYQVKDINLLQGNAQLVKDNLLVVNAPLKDISKEEADKIKSFLASGGRAAFFVDITKEVLPNFQSVLSAYGVKTQNALVVEGQTDMIANSAIELLPSIQSHDIVNAIKSNKTPLYMPVMQGIENLNINKSSLKIEPLLSSSSNSWAKTNLNSTKMSKETGDLNGPFNIAVAITDEDKTSGNTAKLIVVGGTTFMNSNINAATSGTNLDFVMNSFNWLQDKKDSISIRPKNFETSTLMINELQKLTWSGVVVILVPLVIAILGVTVWFRRRHR